jgi:DNA-binding transcriptional LysR family regulator
MRQIYSSYLQHKVFFEMRSLNLDQLRTLMEVAEHGSFSAAARQLNLTQPAVSLQIRDLEQRFGVTLVERARGQVRPTLPGRELIGHAQRVLGDCDGIAVSMARFRDGWLGHVHIGTTFTALNHQLPPILRSLRDAHPGIDLKVSQGPTRETVKHILASEMDIGLVTLPVHDPRLKLTPLRMEHLVAIFPAGARDIPRVVTPAFVARQALIIENEQGAVYRLVMRWLNKHVPLARAPMNMGGTQTVKVGVASNLGMSIVPDVAVAQPSTDIVVRPIDPPVPCPLALVERRGRPRDAALDIVRKALLSLRDGSCPAADESSGPRRKSGRQRAKRG